MRIYAYICKQHGTCSFFFPAHQRLRVMLTLLFPQELLWKISHSEIQYVLVLVVVLVPQGVLATLIMVL